MNIYGVKFAFVDIDGNNTGMLVIVHSRHVCKDAIVSHFRRKNK